ncbi:hypothetical protein SAMN02745121_04441 [Nannocystis exedens]|uniref:Uncharacterized protein n=1 Tax=Nannocystis exedens TaxID=54 RepID=A0A1I2AXI2_9BACT|nr:DUF2330 domain-containing protein [Nannocystis exedens]PCC74340.1 hypothetical protein NAEX_07429 [Nannocystis exedens]SFE48671.1 hypothetical protein SAMN02745121_04441 [Nannocystis exedens]
MGAARSHHDSDPFALPVRLGLLDARVEQDLIVHVLARNTRDEAANDLIVPIPTNLEVADATRGNFPGFFALHGESRRRSRGGSTQARAILCHPSEGPSCGQHPRRASRGGPPNEASRGPGGARPGVRAG